MHFFIKRLEPSTIGVDLPPDSCVLFVHGLVGSTFTWKKYIGFLTKYWKFNDSFGLEYYQYTTEFSLPFFDTLGKAIAGGPAIADLAKGLKTTIEIDCKEFKNIIIIAHSMGGLIARQYLVDTVKVNKEVGKIKALITYASPHRGSAVASWFRIFGRYIFLPLHFTSKQIVQMCRLKSDFITKLNKDWETLRIESKIDFTRVVALGDWIVDKQSAALKWNDPNVLHIPNKGHLSILNPRSQKDTAFSIMFNYLKDFKSNLEKRIEKEELDTLAEEETSEDNGIE